MNVKEILKKRLEKLDKHYMALKEYKDLIDEILQEKNIYDKKIYSELLPTQRAVFDAYLKRFSSCQDFMGAKIFGLLLELAGIGSDKMSEIIQRCEKEQIIDDVNIWIELRAKRNELEHDYPDEIEDALEDMKYCIDSFSKLEQYYQNILEFYKRFS